MSTEYDDSRLPQRFWEKVAIDEGGCWLWTARIQENGYGYFKFGGRGGNSHRHAYQVLVRPISRDVQVDHICHNEDQSCRAGTDCLHRRCVNPAHLRETTSRQNTLSGKTPAAANARKTHCWRGHELKEGNFYGDGRSRKCKRCATIRATESKRRLAIQRKLAGASACRER